jgi:hypothetical protein
MSAPGRAAALQLVRRHAPGDRPRPRAATFELAIPGDPALVGMEFSAQWLVHGPFGKRLAVTRILRPTIGQ